VLTDGWTEEELASVLQQFQPRVVEDYFVHVPHPVQQVALSINAEELLFGGAVGGGKSDYALMCALQYVDVPGYAALILRRTWPDLNAPGAILERFGTWMAPHIQNKSVKKQEGGRTWRFPSGAIIQFGYVNRAANVTKFQGAEYQTIIFDEATLFESEVYQYIRSRLRRPSIPCGVCTAKLTRYIDGEGQVRFKHSKAGGACATPLPDPRALAQYEPAKKDGLTVFDIPLRLRATANPGGISHQFFKERFIDEETREPTAVFIPSTLNDNPSLDREEYTKTLEHLSPVDKERMLNGDWEVMDAGNLFNRGDFEFVDELPRPAEIKSRVRYWDFAASDGQQSDYTVGALCSVTHDGRWFIEDLQRVKYLPPAVERLVRKTAELDGINVKIYAEQEPGSSGKSMMSHFKRRVLAGYHFDGIRSTGTKTARANSLVSQVSAHNVYVKKSSWNQKFLDEASTFPLGQHDDQIDAVAGAFVAMTAMKKPVKLVTSFGA
jgi:predicted phage terminase large subunit-like protein